VRLIGCPLSSKKVLSLDWEIAQVGSDYVACLCVVCRPIPQLAGLIIHFICIMTTGLVDIHEYNGEIEKYYKPSISTGSLDKFG
jgi:hypothetical protein